MQYTPKALFKVACASLCLFLIVFTTKAQTNTPTQTPIPEKKDSVAMGVAISPGKLLFTCKQGNTQSQVVTLTNHTDVPYNFRVGFTDYNQNNSGKPLFTGETSRKSKYSLSKWATISPTFFTLEKGKSQKITVTVTIPDNDSNRIAAWTIMEVDQVKKKQPIANQGSQSMSMGISSEIGLGVYIYQNPPNVKINNIEINKFYYRDTTFIVAQQSKATKQLWMQVSNVGDGISFCTSYAEITNLQTGQTSRLASQQFTILPGFDRDFYYELPKDIPPGDYSAVGVVDFGDKTPKKVAQLSFKITK